MPTIFDILGLRGFFPAGDHQPIHIHVVKGGNRAKIQVAPEVKVIRNDGLSQRDLRNALNLVNEYREEIISVWNQFHLK